MQNPETDSVLGLEQRAVRLRDYTPIWADLFIQEEQRIQAALGSLAVDIQHYGSTSIPGIQAKPILDILVGIKNFGDASLCIPLLEAIGYDYAPQAGIPGDFTFGKGERRTHLVHVVEYTGRNWTDSLRFRDALRCEPKLAREYEALKTALALRFPNNRVQYTEGKADFVNKIIAAANGGKQ